ncbi:GUN4 domain-containing protein [Pseudanabaena sp. UWO310]|uniref:GUN4 domain-containing protein n=1 Tax=Pseudanabaena sp. UWO310 TaxID=2480795 RepID=UPI0011575491|nr:GUN4 domain-containing protein [Pseudanabaena sp. UWO310]TYQ28554.1 GUN4 domain-containing protein [Pseudanabaena sp. UWO310]
MDSEEILIEFVANGDRPKGVSVKSISTTKIKDSIQRLANLVQQLATDSSSSHANGLALDEVEISLKLTDTGEAILLGDGQSNGAMTLRFRRVSSAAAIASPNNTIPTQSLTSSTGVDYTKLRALLAGGKWQEANQETWNVMCHAARKNIGSVLTSEEIKQISCDDLQIIDKLWQQHSQGRYGFSAQNQVYMSSILG